MKDKDVIAILEPHATGLRLLKLQSSLSERTRNMVTVLENPYDGGNVNAAMRSAEAFGFQDFHIVGGPSRLRPSSRTSAGAGKWLDIHVWQSTSDCIAALKAQNFRIVGTTLSATDSIYDVDFEEKTALVFGTEHNGLSEEFEQALDQSVIIPISGMVESFNLSVAVALSLHVAHRQRGDQHGDLSKTDQIALYASYLKRSIPHAKEILKRANQ